MVLEFPRTLLFVALFSLAGMVQAHASNFARIEKRSEIKFFGKGIVDKTTEASLALACVSMPCTQVRWVLSVSADEMYFLGKPLWAYQLNRTVEDDFFNFNVSSKQTPIDSADFSNAIYADLEAPGPHQDALKQYINGLSKEAHQVERERKRRWFSHAKHTYVLGKYSGSDGIFELTPGTDQNTSLQKVSAKTDWNWSTNPSRVNHSYFSKVARFLMKIALEDGAISRHYVSYQIDNYINEIRSDQQANAQLKTYHFAQAATLKHWEHQDEILGLIERLDLE